MWRILCSFLGACSKKGKLLDDAVQALALNAGIHISDLTERLTVPGLTVVSSGTHSAPERHLLDSGGVHPNLATARIRSTVLKTLALFIRSNIYSNRGGGYLPVQLLFIICVRLYLGDITLFRKVLPVLEQPTVGNYMPIEIFVVPPYNHSLYLSLYSSPFSLGVPTAPYIYTGYRYNTHYSSFKSLDHSSFIFKMLERVDWWNPPESWKRITCIMMIRAGHRNKDIMTAAQCSLNTVKTIRHELETCNGDYEDVARRKIPSTRSDCVRTAELLANLQEQVLKNPGIGIRALSRVMNVAAFYYEACTQ
ncbi:hypothetical protein AAG570_001424 [Ranatra chinensis]|uniref:Uncharacterized protein n=1 Tax=Ranatra chinensis TaxID=642074 RepID=A0ABD0YBU4_9HEMI